MSVVGYYRHPTIWGDRVVFVCEDDLWQVDVEGGVATRLTANPGIQTRPRFSPDGRLVAFISRDEGRLDVFVMDADGGPPRRLSYFGSWSLVAGWSPDGGSVLVATDHAQPFAGWTHLWSVPLDGTQPVPLQVGPAFSVSFSPNGRGMVIGRHAFDPARWKRYRGGRVGSIWVRRRPDESFRRLVQLDGNVADPMWVGRRIYFISDHEGVGNLYSVTPTGRGLRRHTAHEGFYARHPSTDGRRIVYHCGGDLWLFDPEADETRPLQVTVPSARPQRNRRFVPPGKYLETFDLHPGGHSLAVVARGGAFTMPLWEGAVRRHGPPSTHRRRLAAWSHDGETLISVTDEPGEEALVVERADGTEVTRIEGDLGRLRTVDPQPGGSRVAITNHRHELLLVEPGRRRPRLVHRSPHSWIDGTSWSPDGRWLAFSAAVTRTTQNLFLYDTSTGRVHRIGRPQFRDRMPIFDPSGRYLLFLGGRVFDPVADQVFHDYGFPRSVVPMLIPLRRDVPSPFSAAHRPPRAPGDRGDDEAKPPEAVDIDLDGLADRVQAFPVPPGRYTALGAAEHKVFMLLQPLTGSLGTSWSDDEPPKGQLQVWDLMVGKLETVTDGVTDFQVRPGAKTLAIRYGRRLRVVPVGWRDDKSTKDAPGRDTGWVDLDRIRIEVVPGEEWRQMFREAWRLQRDHFWSADMSGVDWVEIHDRYLALVDRVASRSEFSDLLWEMQGELGTSHAYELGGDYRPEPAWSQGHLGADLEWSRGAWRVRRIPAGDAWDPKAVSPLAAPGVDVRPGDRILAVDGVTLSADTPPESRLVDKAGRPVTLRVARGRSRPREVVVVPLESETPLRYRDWVETNRALVREMSDGRAGYLHIPDMGPAGFAEFHRSWLSELAMDGLVIDVRFNRGGNVSQLLLRRLIQRRIGYRVSRWREPWAFPEDAPAGPMVCLTNEMAGSDGDIFSHSFKMHRLGPLVGTRTWGGVVGIWPQHWLVDGTMTTQPEFGTWFADVGYGVENYGTDPDIEVEITPDDYAARRDPQLERAVAELMRIVESSQPFPPPPEPPPPVLPPRLTPGGATPPGRR
ncbi:MAG: tricorn protease [Acidimicrobiia bacterium]|nr:MAG: tricorn protease [Acidimicrobiia bacterium]